MLLRRFLAFHNRRRSHDEFDGNRPKVQSQLNRIMMREEGNFMFAVKREGSVILIFGVKRYIN
jgi:hypothetical protein